MNCGTDHTATLIAPADGLPRSGELGVCCVAECGTTTVGVAGILERLCLGIPPFQPRPFWQTSHC